MNYFPMLTFSQVLDCLLEVRNKPLTEKPAASSIKPLPTPSSKSTDVENAFRELDSYNAMTEREKLDFERGHDGSIK